VPLSGIFSSSRTNDGVNGLPKKRSQHFETSISRILLCGDNPSHQPFVPLEMLKRKQKPAKHRDIKVAKQLTADQKVARHSPVKDEQSPPEKKRRISLLSSWQVQFNDN